MTIVLREEWMAKPATSSTGITDVKGVAIHWEGATIGAPTHDQCSARVRQIQADHLAGRNSDHKPWADIAYNMVVCRHGAAFVGRGPKRRSAANGSNEGNSRYYSICVLMGPNDLLTEEAKTGVLEAREYLIKNGNAGGEVRTHRSFIATQCPGDALADWVSGGLHTSYVNTAGNSGETSDDSYSVEAMVMQLPTRKQGDNDQHTKILQGLLVANGRKVTIDGIFGPATTAALKDWQAATNRTADGVCGPVSWRGLLCI